MTKRFVGTVLGALALLAAPRQANAQDVPLARLLVELIQSDVRLASNTHDAHFIPGAEQQIAPFFFNQQLVTKLATVPIGSPAGGFRAFHAGYRPDLSRQPPARHG